MACFLFLPSFPDFSVRDVISSYDRMKETEVMCECCCWPFSFLSFISWKDRSLTISSFPLSCVMSYVFSLPSTRSLPKHHYPRKPFTPKRQEEKRKVLERLCEREREKEGKQNLNLQGERNDSSQLLHHVIKTDTHSLVIFQAQKGICT